MKGQAAAIEPSKFDWGEAKLSCYGRDSGAGSGVIARYEHDLSLPLQRRIRSKLCHRQMIEGLYQACSDKGLGHDFRIRGDLLASVDCGSSTSPLKRIFPLSLNVLIVPIACYTYLTRVERRPEFFRCRRWIFC